MKDYISKKDFYYYDKSEDKTKTVFSDDYVGAPENIGDKYSNFLVHMNEAPIDSLIPPMEDDDTFFDANGILTKRPNTYQDDDEQEEDMVNHPSHYTWLKEKCGIEVIDITRHLDFDIGNAVKYLLRHGHKPEKGLTIKKKAIQDLEKAIFYIKDKIEQIKKEW